MKIALLNKLTAFSLLAGLSLASCSPGKSTLQPCATDYDCQGEQLCINNLCTGGSCYSDNDCPGEEVCESSVCVNPSATSGNSPQETYQGFVQALKSSNLEQALTYFHPLSREEFRGIISEKGLSDLAQQLNGTSPANCSSGNAQECTIKIEGEEYPIQFLQVKENGQETYKIRNL